MPIRELPHVADPEKGFWVTANENLVPKKYSHRDAVGWEWADSSRANRIAEVLSAQQTHTFESMLALQFDYQSLPARKLVPLLKDLKSDDAFVESARLRLLSWNFTLEKNSVEAAIYVTWEKKMSSNLRKLVVPEAAMKLVRSIPLVRMSEWVTLPTGIFAGKTKARNEFVIQCLEESVADLRKLLGEDMNQWQYGQEKHHRVLIKHLLSNAVDEKRKGDFELGPLPRGGYGSTPGMTTNTLNQTAGASFRMVVDVADWDKAMFTNTPGQSGDARSRFYKNLFVPWANDRHFPGYYSREKIEPVVVEKFRLVPADR